MDTLIAAVDLLSAPASRTRSHTALTTHAPRHQRLSDLQRWTCVVMHQQGYSKSHIAKHLKVRRHTVADVVRRFAITQTPNSGSRSGRPRMTTPEQDKSIVDHARAQHFTSPVKVRRQLCLTLSPDTIDRRLQEAGLFGRVARHKRNYTEEEVRKRLAFAEGYKEMDWSRVIFSDEKKFNGKGWNGRVWVRRPVGTAYEPQYCVDKKAHPVNVNMWGCFSVAGPGYITIFKENLDGALQKKILEDNLLATADEHKMMDGQWYFLHDNAPTFAKPRVVQDWLHNNGITCIEHPPYSPDLNPIENLWAWMEERVDRSDADTFEKLQDAVAACWEKMRSDVDVLAYMRILAESMPRRCQAVIDAKGWHTKY